eukprot:15365740-Ditylum_brightwellii.AAC.3
MRDIRMLMPGAPSTAQHTTATRKRSRRKQKNNNIAVSFHLSISQRDRLRQTTKEHSNIIPSISKHRANSQMIQLQPRKYIPSN